MRAGSTSRHPRRRDAARAPQADRWYSQDLRGGTEAEARVLALLVARFAANGAALTWAVDVLADADGYVDGAPWIPPDQTGQNFCVGDAAFNPLAPLAGFCPKSCNCRAGMTGCPTTCPAATGRAP